MTTTKDENAIGLKQYDKIARDLLLYNLISNDAICVKST